MLTSLSNMLYKQGMRKDTAIAFFGSVQATATAINVRRSAVYQWGEIVPAVSALKLSAASDGKLKFDSSAYLKAHKNSTKRDGRSRYVPPRAAITSGN